MNQLANILYTSPLYSLLEKDNKKHEARLKVININNEFELNQHVLSICHQHQEKKQWILMVNPQNKPLEHLVNNQLVKPEKILRVNGKNQSIGLQALEKVLTKGNCSAVVLFNCFFDDQQLVLIENYAQRGNTQCYLVNQTTTIH